jgi:hypothetical protein
LLRTIDFAQRHCRGQRGSSRGSGGIEIRGLRGLERHVLRKSAIGLPANPSVSSKGSPVGKRMGERVHTGEVKN